MEAWPITLVAVHAAAAYALALLYTKAPDIWQKWIIGMFMIVMLLMIAAYAYSLDPGDRIGPFVRWIAQELEHLAVLLFCVRLIWKEKLSCPPNSSRS